MAAYLSEVVSTIFRPSVAALFLAVGAGMASEGSQLPGGHKVNMIDLSCAGVLSPICEVF